MKGDGFGRCRCREHQGIPRRPMCNCWHRQYRLQEPLLAMLERPRHDHRAMRLRSYHRITNHRYHRLGSPTRRDGQEPVQQSDKHGFLNLVYLHGMERRKDSQLRPIERLDDPILLNVQSDLLNKQRGSNLQLAKHLHKR